MFITKIRNKGQWNTMVSNTNPIARQECSFVAVGDTFYLLRGRGIKPVSIYNTKTNTCEGKEPPVEIHHFQEVSPMKVAFTSSEPSVVISTLTRNPWKAY